MQIMMRIPLMYAVLEENPRVISNTRPLLSMPCSVMKLDAEDLDSFIAVVEKKFPKRSMSCLI